VTLQQGAVQAKVTVSLLPNTCTLSGCIAAHKRVPDNSLVFCSPTRNLFRDTQWRIQMIRKMQGEARKWSRTQGSRLDTDQEGSLSSTTEWPENSVVVPVMNIQR